MCGAAVTPAIRCPGAMLLTNTSSICALSSADYVVSIEVTV